MSKFLNDSLTEFTYLMERISIVTKEFSNKLDKDDDLYCLIHEIYKSTQSINYEFVKLCYNIRSDNTIKIDIPGINNINIPIEKIKDISEYINFIKDSCINLKDSYKIINLSSKKYCKDLNNELSKFRALINELDLKKIS
ncbi:hypothetical protein SAMN04487886_104511 [Clostridium sp. DSM 8431]|uniref:hypothetical protein n=1 Tax=Clostridium sp. DSM 8431 TaxID=1761781 RepID=UPI0008EA3A74|nr:hypothetical protein [Clostridium sp. DSM 8431]SFU51469.1 hypothetical protein SAMN04487886_104511 [Clostridium sp. DSM 8431]